MGNSCSHVTVQEVTEDLEAKLLAAAKTQLPKDFPSQTVAGSTLQDYAEALAKGEFNKMFKYPWSSTGCNPPNVEKINPRIHSVYDFCIIAADHDLTKAIGEYVSQGLASAGLDSWMKNKAASDLAATLGKVANFPCDNEWHYDTCQETYDATNVNEDSYQLDVSVIYTNGTRTESAVEVTLHILFFVGVYYTIDSPKATTFGALQSQAYTAAQKLAGVTQNPVSDNIQLTTALSQYGGPIFSNKWNYDYKNGKPKDMATDEKEPVYTKSEHLCPFQGKAQTDSQINTYLNLYIMNGFTIPIKDIENLVRQDIKTEFQNLLANPNSNSWGYLPIDKEYGLHQASERPLKLNAMVIYWVNSATIDVNNSPVTVDMIYMYFFGVIYELEEDPILQDMTQVLCKNIPNIIQSTIPQHITPDNMKAFVETYNVSKFDKEYGFHFPDNDSGINAKVKYWRGFFEFSTYNPLPADIKDKVTEQLFGPDPTQDEEIKHGLQKPLYDFIVDHFTDFSGTSYAKDDNEWYNQIKLNNFPYKPKADESWLLQARTSWAYANGTMTEDSHGGETTQYFYLSLLLYVTAEKDDDSDSDV